MKLRRLVALLTISFAFAVDAKEFRSADIHPDDYPTVMGVKYMGELVAKRSGGRHSIKVYPNSQLGGEKEAVEQAKNGSLDFIRVNVGLLNSVCPETIVPTMPFLFRSKEHLRNVVDGPIGDEILKSCEQQGLVGLAFYDSGALVLHR